MFQHGPLCLDVFVEPMFVENALLVWPDGERECWVVDPGLPPQAEELIAAVRKRALTLRAIVLTHGHVDHIAGVAEVKAAFAEASIWAPRDEEHMLLDADANLSGVFGVPIVAPPADRLLEPGETLTLGPLAWDVRDVAGHSPGGLAFYCEAAGVAIVGDALFADGIGRYDFPGSSGERLLANIHDHLMSLPDKTVVYSGHGLATTIGRERVSNPYLLGRY